MALNAALDVTYVVDGVRWHAGNRVTSVAERAGGKGTNVARVLSALGHEVVVTGLVAGNTGERIRRDLAAAGISEAFLPVPGESRRTLAVVDTIAGDATGFWEAGPRIAAEHWAAFLDHYRRLLPSASGVALSGSAPTGLPEDAYAQLVAAARDAGVPAVLDADGTALRLGVAAGPEIVKPNAEELRAATGHDDPLAGSELLLRDGANAVVVSVGADGLVASTPQHRWMARPPARLSGNPTGAGDACVAGLVRGLVTGSSWPERLAEAVALSAAAVLRPLAGDVDLDAYRRFRDSVLVKEV
ncbi:1-phosphofructokinase family hexose kinase [Micromonospora sp. NPDC049679]|uniref:1-phosphofructokinase family hexose kinase n=1 Tax=Micromonospora sp. NPDC049679 TaxID=3155920 RepID=UPI0033EF219E